jgi:hypothetical protein
LVVELVLVVLVLVVELPPSALASPEASTMSDSRLTIAP